MLIPSSLKIGGHIYAVVRKELDGKCGETDHVSQTICIDSALGAGTRAQVTLFHEVQHVLNSELDHALLDSLAEQNFQWLHDNGLLVDSPSPS